MKISRYFQITRSLEIPSCTNQTKSLISYLCLYTRCLSQKKSLVFCMGACSRFSFQYRIIMVLIIMGAPTHHLINKLIKDLSLLYVELHATRWRCTPRSPTYWRNSRPSAQMFLFIGKRRRNTLKKLYVEHKFYIAEFLKM